MLAHRGGSNRSPSNHAAPRRPRARRRGPSSRGSMQRLVLRALVIVTCCFFVTTYLCWTRSAPSLDVQAGRLLHVVGPGVEGEQGEQHEQPSQDPPTEAATPAPLAANSSTATNHADTSRTGDGTSNNLEALSSLLAQYRAEALVHQQKRQSGQEDDPFALRTFQQTLAVWQTKPDVQAFARAVGDRVQGALRSQQEHCNRTLTCNLNKDCGFGCQVHHAIHCLQNAVATRRALALKVHPWSYSRKYERYFRRVSGCRARAFSKRQRRKRLGKQSAKSHVFLDIIDDHTTPWEPPHMPPDVYAEVAKFHARPELWWVGQLARSLLDLVDEPGMVDYPPPPYTAVHVRRTDKIGTEAEEHDLSEYMRHARHPHVYLATDEPDVVASAQRQYPNHTFYSNVEGAADAKDARYTDASLRGLIQDIFALARADFLVGTFSSQISRLAYELAQTRQVDGTHAAHSVDSDWYFGGWVPYVRCLREPWGGFPAGYPIHFNGEVIEQIGHVQDERTQTLFPLHLTENCSPNFPNLFDDGAKAPIQEPSSAFEAAVLATTDAQVERVSIGSVVEVEPPAVAAEA